ncbi:CASTOR/POLLUX-related putative ion channel [Marinimicrobium alkaliphilum]|uniref:CASTOR/POLLUX-related putative ion channel n=1 Tax=Marinimicrobium alkaliphilum TaxID=2202654 RepID=UPI000DB998D0|nr:ion channel DMI1 [Marinimicrobium alkaliphilum]
MPGNLFNRLRYLLERFFTRGPHYQLLLMVAFIGLISATGGLLLRVFDAEQTLLDSIWWAFLRLTDPGYLGDDEGFGPRVISTFLTVSGYVLFMGSLIAIMTQWLFSQMRLLERGLTPVSLKHHIVILGWTNRTQTIARELWLAEGRVKRLLRRLGAREQLNLVILAEELDSTHHELLRTDTGLRQHRRHTILRSGSALNHDHLHRAACLDAAAVIVPGHSFSQTNHVSSDIETIKTLLSLDAEAKRLGKRHPFVVAELQEPQHVAIAQRAYQGPVEVVPGDAFISRLMVQTLRHPGLSGVYAELLSHDIGQSFYIFRDVAFDGMTAEQLRAELQEGIFCGVVRGRGNDPQAILNPEPGFRMENDDALVMLAASYDQAAQRSPTGKPAAPTAPGRRISPGASQHKRLLVLGWSRKIPTLLAELSTYAVDRYEVTVVSTRSIAERVQYLEDSSCSWPGVTCEHLQADVTNAHQLEQIDLAPFDSIMLMSSERLGSGEEADARSMVAYLLLEQRLRNDPAQKQLLIELSDPNNERLMGQRLGEVIIGPLLLSHILAQVALRRELRPVVDELFTAGGPELTYRRLDEYGLSPGTFNFEQLQLAAAACGETALGILAQEKTHLNPARATRLTLSETDAIISIVTLNE